MSTKAQTIYPEIARQAERPGVGQRKDGLRWALVVTAAIVAVLAGTLYLLKVTAPAPKIQSVPAQQARPIALPPAAESFFAGRMVGVTPPADTSFSVKQPQTAGVSSAAASFFAGRMSGPAMAQTGTGSASTQLPRRWWLGEGRPGRGTVRN
jgi:hypothetical protein